jgi:hypothetical protein
MSQSYHEHANSQKLSCVPVTIWPRHKHTPSKGFRPYTVPPKHCPTFILVKNVHPPIYTHIIIIPPHQTRSPIFAVHSILLSLLPHISQASSHNFITLHFYTNSQHTCHYLGQLRLGCNYFPLLTGPMQCLCVYIYICVCVCVGGTRSCERVYIYICGWNTVYLCVCAWMYIVIQPNVRLV